MSPPKIGLRAVMEMTGFNRGFKAYDKAVNKMDVDTTGASSRMSRTFKALGVGLAGFGVGAAAGLAAVGGAALKLATDAAPLQGVGDAFRGLGGDIEALREGSLGLATDADLMKSFNTAAQLVSKDFAETLPDAMGYLSKVSASTGSDMNFMIDSLVKGVGRLSGPILDNLGIQVQLSDFTARAAEMFGKEADELEKAEIQAGAMNVVLEKLQQNTADMPDVTGTAATKMGQLQTQLKNTADSVGLALVPALSDLLDVIGPLAEDLGPKLVEFAGDFVEALGGVITTTQDLIETWRNLQAIETAASEERKEDEGTWVKIVRFATEADAAIRNLTDAQWIMNLGARAAGEALGIEAQATQEFASAMSALMLDAPIESITAALREFDEAVKQSGSDAVVWQEDMTNVLGGVIAEYEALADAWRRALAPEALAEATGGVVSVMLDHANQMAGIVESGAEKTREIDFNAGLKRQIAQAEFSAKMLQAEAEFQAKRAIIEATGDQVALAQLEAAYARETAQSEQAFAEGQARSQFNEDIQGQIRERSQIIQQITQQKAFIAELETQKEFIRATLEAAVIKAQAAGKISAAEAQTILQIVGTGQIEQLKNQQLFTIEATRLATEWANGQIGAAKSTVLAYEQVQKALDGQIESAKIGLERLDQELQDFEVSLPPLKLPELPSLPELDLGVDKLATGAAEVAGKTATESAERVVSSVVSSMAKAIEDAGAAIKDIVGFEIPEGFDEGLDQMGFAMVKMAGKFNAMWSQFETEITATALVSPAVEAMGKAFGAFFKGIEQVGKFEMASGADFINRLDAYIWALKLTSGKIFKWMQEIDADTRAQVKEAGDVAKNVKALFAIIGPDLSKIVAAPTGFEAGVDLFFEQMRYVGIKIMGWLLEIDEESRVALAAAVPVAENIGKIFSGVGNAISTVVDLAGLKDFEGVDMDVWKIIKTDIQALLTDISAWNLSVDDDAIDSVIGKLVKLSAVVTNLSEIVIGINDMADVGGLDVSAARGIMAQFNQLLGPGPSFTGPFQGLSEPAGSINPPAVPSPAAGGGGGTMGTIRIEGKFEGPGGEFVTFVKDFIVGTVTDILLGDVGNPDYAV